MTHPLTEKTSDKLYEEFVDSNFSHWDNVDFLKEDGFITTQNLMQIGADWQLEQVIDWLKDYTKTVEFLKHPHYVVTELEKAMRPQENK